MGEILRLPGNPKMLNANYLVLSKICSASLLVLAVAMLVILFMLVLVVVIIPKPRAKTDGHVKGRLVLAKKRHCSMDCVSLLIGPQARKMVQKIYFNRWSD